MCPGPLRCGGTKKSLRKICSSKHPPVPLGGPAVALGAMQDAMKDAMKYAMKDAMKDAIKDTLKDAMKDAMKDTLKDAMKDAMKNATMLFPHHCSREGMQ